jgi:hypothetical protein
MRRLFLSTAALCTALAASTADAQTCQGYSSFSSGALRVGAGADYSDAVKTYGGGVAFSPRNGKMFVGGKIGHVKFDGINDSAVGYGGQGGYQIDLGGQQSFQVCPVIGLDYVGGPKNLGGAIGDMSTMSMYGGMQIGARYRGSPSLELVPTTGLTIQRASVKYSGTATEPDAETFAMISLGSGFVYNRNLTIIPTVEIPMGLAGADKSFQIAVSYNFMGGSRGRTRR